MNEFIQFQYPAWLILPAALLGVGFAIFLYYRESEISTYNSTLPYILGVIRALVVTLLAILLLGPFLSYIISEEKNPVIVVAQDASQSIAAMTGDTTLNTLRANFDQLERRSDDWAVNYFSFGESVRPHLPDSFSDRRTDFAELFKQVKAQYQEDQLGAVVLASDGIMNSGQNPLYFEDRFASPLYVLPLGDTTSRKDISIEKIFHNRIAYLGDRFKIEADIRGQFTEGVRSTVSLQKISDGSVNTIEQRSIEFETNDELKTLEFTLNARPAGWNHYRLAVEPTEDEQTNANNVKDFYVEILEAEQHIRIVSLAPHPDVSAMKQSLEGNKNYRVQASNASSFEQPSPEPDVVLFHQVPGRGGAASNSWIDYVNEQNIPALFITGSQSNISRLNDAQNILDIVQTNGQVNEITPLYNSNFSLFQLDDDRADQLKQFPPLKAPYGEYKPNPRAQVLFYQQIGTVETEYPLLIMGRANNRRTGVLAAEDFWRWRLFDYLQHGDHSYTDKLLSSIVQYLTTTEDKRRFRVYSSDQMYGENEKISFEAELYNASYELTTEPDVQLVIEDENGKTYEYTFQRSTDYYTLNAGLLPEGNYRYRAETTLGGETFEASGQFNVRPLQLELYNLQADHRFLRNLVERYGGEIIDTDRVESLTDLFEENDRLKPILYSSTRTSLLLDLPWMIALLIVLLGAEWFLRRWAGSY